MTNEQFDQLVNRTQAKYGSRPWSLRWRIAWMVALGYVGFLATLLCVLVVSALLMAGASLAGQAPSIFLVAIVALLLAFGISQALVVLWVPLESQKAREVTREEVPNLFRLFDTLNEELGVAPFSHVRITADFNASVQMIPRLGVFGLNRNHLYLGLPLMRALTPRQFCAVLAHEFAHSSSRHDRFGMWIYRLRQSWGRVFAELHEVQARGTFLHILRTVMLWYINWYWPRFNALAFVLSRMDEYEADRIAAQRTSAETAAETLFRIECIGMRLNDEFWTAVTQRARTEADVPSDILESQDIFLTQPPAPEDAARWLRQSTQTMTGNVDTHPSLSDRIKALGLNVDQFADEGFPQIPRRMDSAASMFLESALSQITDDVNRQWQKESTLRWQNLYHQARRAEKHLESAAKPNPVESIAVVERSVRSAVSVSQEEPFLDTADVVADPIDRLETQKFDVDQVWQQVKAVCELRGIQAAEPLLRQLLGHRPKHAPANVTLGRYLLEQGNAEGEQLLRRVLEEDDNDLVPVACHELIAHFQQFGQSEKIREARGYLSRFETAQAEGAKERSIVTASDRFAPHGLSDTELKALSEQLAEQPDLAVACLVQKQLRYFQKQRLFVLVVHTAPTGFFGSTNSQCDQVLVSQLITRVKLPGRTLIIAPQGGFRKLARKILTLPDAEVFRR